MSGSRRARLADRRAAALLRAVCVPGTRVLPAAGGFRIPDGAAAAPAAVVIDPARPEEPGDHDERLLRLIADCAAGGTVALIACGGATAAGPLAPRGWAAVRTTLAAAGFTVSMTPFDVLGACSPWRTALGARRERVLAELDAHLAAPSVRRAAALVETHLVAGLTPERTGRVLLVGRRTPGPPPAMPSRAAFDAAMRPLLHDDAVMRWLAFVDAELLAGAGVDTVAWVRAAASPAVGALLRSRGRWWHEDLEVQRLAEAAAYRLAHETMRALGGDVAATLEYDLVAAFNEAIAGWVDEDRPA